MGFDQFIDDLEPENPRTCRVCLGEDGWWEDYMVRPEDDHRPNQNLQCGMNVYWMWMPCARCCELASSQLEMDFPIPQKANQ